MKERLKEILCSFTGLVIVTLLIWVILIAVICLTAEAGGPGYDRLEQTENAAVIELTERAAESYPICPELLQAIVFYESSNRMSARNGKCVGYMQVSETYHSDRADRLGVSIYDGYGNILTGTDYLMELIGRYDDAATALMVYHGERNAVEKAERCEISSYAQRILELSEKLERLHGK